MSGVLTTTMCTVCTTHCCRLTCHCTLSAIHIVVLCIIEMSMHLHLYLYIYMTDTVPDRGEPVKVEKGTQQKKLQADALNSHCEESASVVAKII